MKRPIVFICVSLILGILFAAYFRGGFLIPYILMFAFLLLSLVFLGREAGLKLFLFLAVFLLGVCVYRNADSLPKNHIYFFTPVKGESVCLEGRVASFVRNKKKQDFF